MDLGIEQPLSNLLQTITQIYHEIFNAINNSGFNDLLADIADFFNDVINGLYHIFNKNSALNDYLVFFRNSGIETLLASISAIIILIISISLLSKLFQIAFSFFTDNMANRKRKKRR